jgi:hypothetical protein
MSKIKNHHISYNSIEQYRNVLRDLKKAKKNPLFNIPDEIEFVGTIKLHGTNAGVCYNNVNGIYCQSRNNVINLTYDNQGFAMFVEKNKDTFINFFKILSDKFKINLDEFILSIYGEWCGQNIQKGVALTKLPKCFCIFDCKVSKINTSDENEFKSYWLDVSFKENDKTVLSKSDDLIYNIYDFETYRVKVNIENFGESQKELTELTESVEKCCPFAKKLGVEGTGEGIVWRYNYEDGNRWIFKTKGEEHKVTKEKVLIPIDVEKIENIKEFVDKTCTTNRFHQAIDSLYKTNIDSPIYNKQPEMKHSKYIINWIRDDIVKEETDTLIANNLDTKDIISGLSKKIIEYMKTIM